MDLFTLFGRIAIDSGDSKTEIDEIKKSAEGLAEELNAEGPKTEKAAQKIGKATVFWGNLAAGATEAAVKFLMRLPGASVKAAASVEAEEAAFQSTFGTMADEATKRYQQIANETNILETRLRSAGTQGFAQLKGAGVEANDALSESERFLRLAADAASYYDISLESASEKIRSFMRGNTEAGDAIGLFTSESQRNMYALEKYGEKWQNLNEAQRQLMLLDVADDIYKQNGVIGQAIREGKEYANVTANMTEAQTQALANLGGPIKDSLLPALDKLSLWLADSGTQENLSSFGKTLGKIASVVFDGMLAAFDWLANNGEAVGVGLGVIAAGLAAGAIAAHPYAAAITAIAVGLAALAGGKDFDDMHFGDFSQEDLDLLQKYVDARNRLNELEAQAQYTTDWRVLNDYTDAQAAYNAVSKEVDAIEGLKEAYYSWLNTQGHTADMPFLDVPVKVAEGAEGEIQSELGGMSLEAVVHLLPDASQLSNLSSIAAGDFGKVSWNAEGAIFSKPTIFNTPLGLQGVGDGRSPEAVAPIDKLQQYVSSAVQGAVGGMQFNVVLDSGVLVGQLAPQMDMRLGTISGRKGRGN